MRTPWWQTELRKMRACDGGLKAVRGHRQLGELLGEWGETALDCEDLEMRAYYVCWFANALNLAAFLPRYDHTKTYEEKDLAIVRWASDHRRTLERHLKLHRKLRLLQRKAR